MTVFRLKSLREIRVQSTILTIRGQDDHVDGRNPALITWDV